MNIRPLLSVVCLLAASVSLFISTGAAGSGLSADSEAHRACVDRLEALAREQDLPLQLEPTWEAPQPAAGEYHFYFNARVRGAEQRFYRVECEALRAGRVTFFALEPGRWVYAEPDVDGFAAR